MYVYMLYIYINLIKVRIHNSTYQFDPAVQLGDVFFSIHRDTNPKFAWGFLAITGASQSLLATKPGGMEEIFVKKSQSLPQVGYFQQSYQRYAKVKWGETFYM